MDLGCLLRATLGGDDVGRVGGGGGAATLDRQVLGELLVGSHDAQTSHLLLGHRRHVGQALGEQPAPVSDLRQPWQHALQQ
eukprot:4492377-Pyramimonas_sp.AAC.1